MGLRSAPKEDAQLEMFSALFSDIATRDARETMEVPFLSLTKRPRFEPIRYRNGDVEIVVTGGKPYGIANIWDWDLIMWLLSQIRQALDEGKCPSRKIRFHRQAFLRDARRAAGGAQYRRLEQSIERLSNTNVFTTIRPGPGRKTVKFSWIEYAEMERDENGRITRAVVVLPEWLYEAACDNRRVLSIDRDYFRLMGGLERWLYRIVRKGAGTRPWRWKLRTLHERSASTQAYKYFARDLRRLVAGGSLLGFRLSIIEERGESYLLAEREGHVRRPKGQTIEPQLDSVDPVQCLRLRTRTYERARAVAPGYDVYALEAEWRAATERNGVRLQDPDAAFVAWCRRVDERKPLGR